MLGFLLVLILAEQHRHQHIVQNIRSDTRRGACGARGNGKHIRRGLVRIVNDRGAQVTVRRTVDDLELRVHRADLLQLLVVVVLNHILILGGGNLLVGEVDQFHPVARVHQAHQNVEATLGDVGAVHGHQIEAIPGRNEVLHNHAGIVDVSVKRCIKF